MSESSKQENEEFTVSITTGLAAQIRNYIASKPGTNTSHVFEEALELWCHQKYEQSCLHSKLEAELQGQPITEQDKGAGLGSIRCMDEDQELDPDQLFGRY